MAAVTSGQEAEPIIAKDEENSLSMTILPIVEESKGETSRVNLTVDVRAVANGKTYTKRMQFTNIAGADNSFQDKQSDSEMSLEIKAPIVP